MNYATERWLEVATGRILDREQRRKWGLEFEFDGKAACWIGDVRVYGWHRTMPTMGGEMAACALMALEKWLYDEIESGRSIGSWVRYLFAHAEALAFAGVLVSVGMKYPHLFTEELLPLLGNRHIYRCQRNWAVGELQETWRIELSSLAKLGEQILRLAIEWHSMPHRRQVLQDVTPILMLQHEGTRKYLSERRAEWVKQAKAAGEGGDNLEFFLARFDLSNYTETPEPDGRVKITMRWPAPLEAKAQQSQQERNLKMLALELAPRARQYLSEQGTLQPQELLLLVDQVRRLANWTSSSADQLMEQYRINSIAGGIAVLVVQHRAWLSQDPELEKWCMEILRGLRPGENSEYDTPVSALNSTAESFLGEAGVALLEESGEECVLRMAFEGVTGFYYRSTLQTMWRAYLLREQLGEKFEELTNIVVFWSALRRGANRESGYEANRTSLAKYKKTLFHRYTAGKFRGELIPLGRAETLGRRLVERIARRLMSPEERRMRQAHQEWAREHGRDRKLDRDIPNIDFQVLQKGFGFLSAMVRDPLPGDEQRLRHYMRELFDLEMRTLPRPKPGEESYEIEGTPYEFDVWVMARIAEFLVKENSVEAARCFYRPIIELGPAGHYWVKEFLQSWVSIGLEMTVDFAEFGKIWEDMVQYAMTLPAWQPGESGYWSRAESLAVDLVGLHETAASVLGQAKHKGMVSAMAPVFDQWASRWLKGASEAAWFAHFLPTESGQVLLSQGIKHLAGVVGSFEDRAWLHHGIGEVLTAALAACWKQLQNEVELEPDLQKAFLDILTELCARQVPEALHLRTKVSEVLGTQKRS